MNAPQSPADVQRNRAAWITALESGDYAQGTNRLRSGDAYCCWGVLCEISGIGTWNADRHFESRGGPLHAVSATEKTPADHVLALVGVDRSDASLLMSANDSGLTFHTIAQMIRDIPLPLRVQP